MMRSERALRWTVFSALVLLAGGSAGAMSVSVDQPGKSGGKACVRLESDDEPIAGVQCDLVWNPSCVSMEGKCVANPAHGKTLSSSKRGEGGLRAILLAFDNLDPIPDGELFCCTFKTTKCDGDCCAIGLQGVMGSTPKGEARQSRGRAAGILPGVVSNAPAQAVPGGISGNAGGADVAAGGAASGQPQVQVMPGGGAPAAGVAPAPGGGAPAAGVRPGGVAGAGGVAAPAAPGAANMNAAPGAAGVPAAPGAAPAGSSPAVVAAPMAGGTTPALPPAGTVSPSAAVAAGTAVVTAATAPTKPAVPTQPKAAATVPVKRGATPTERVESKGWGCQVDAGVSPGGWPLLGVGLVLVALRRRSAT